MNTKESVKELLLALNNETRNQWKEITNYSTRIAYHQDNKLYINISKYSKTTSKIQSRLKELASGFEIVEYEGK